ncbi:MAG TPA: hypothetical protein VHT03_09765 [Rhizomicrobium sp.]|nr:hypothetical protein [Rhizomicrobium sp.]
MGTRIDPGSLVAIKLRAFARDAELGSATGFLVDHKGQLFLINGRRSK